MKMNIRIFGGRCFIECLQKHSIDIGLVDTADTQLVTAICNLTNVLSGWVIKTLLSVYSRFLLYIEEERLPTINYIMTKTFKFIVSTLAAVTLMVSAASASYTHTGLLKMGMTSSQVMSLQQTLNSGGFLISTTGAGSPGMESMYFGAKTKAAVMAFQAAKGLGHDGVVGAQTGAALAAMTGGSVSYPAGCSSTSGYSTTTGQSCASAGNLPTGCSSTAGYSPVTGAACNGSSNGGNTGGALTGTAGDITVSSYSSGLETQVGEGENNQKVLGFEVEADAGSDVSLNSVKVTLEKSSGSGSSRLTRYADTVSVWDESGTKIGSVSTADFSESSNVYTRSIPLSNVVVRADKKARFFVSVDAVDNIDSGDQDTYWAASVSNIRFSDASGAILTDSSTVSKTFQFTSLASSSDIELKVNLSSSNLKAQTVKVSTTSQTNGVELLKFTMKSQGSSMHVDQLPVTLTSTSTGVMSITGNVTLNIDGQSFSETVSGSGTSLTVLFNDLNLDFAKDETVTATITADINSLTGNYAQGETLAASITSALVTATSGNYIDVEDVNGDQLVTGDRSGSATGETMTFRSTGVNTVMGTPSYNRTTDQNGLVTSVTYTIPVAVTSFGNTLYVGQSAQLATSVSGSNAFALAFQQSGAPTTDEVTSSASIALSSSDAVIESNGFRLDDGSTKHFVVEVTLNTPTTTAANYRVQLKQAQTFTNAALYSGATSSSLLPAEQFRTDFKFING